MQETELWALVGSHLHLSVLEANCSQVQVIAHAPQLTDQMHQERLVKHPASIWG